MTDAAKPGLVGARVKRVEDPRFLRGLGRYVADVRLPGALEVAFARSDLAHADIIGVDVAAAAQLAGVVRVLTGSDPLVAGREIRGEWQGEGWQSSAQPALVQERARFAGEALVAVAAESRYVAEDAVAMIRIEYGERPPLVSAQAALADGAQPLHDGWTSNVFRHTHFLGGDPDGAFAAADGTFELRTWTHRQTGVPIETRACVASYDAGTETLTAWMTNQMPSVVRTSLADVLGLDEHRIRVIAPDIGGGFGVKAYLYPEDVVVCLLALELRRPVRWIEDRREHLLAAVHARQQEHRLEVAHRADGKVLGLRAKVFVDSGAYSVSPWTAGLEAGNALSILPGPYTINHYECDTYAVATNKAPFGPVRGVARPAAAFSIERLLDQVGKATGLDPIEVRRRNLIDEADCPYTTVTGNVIDSASFHQALQTLCEAADYDALRRDQQEARRAGRLVGIGVACYAEQGASGIREYLRRGMPTIFGYETALVRMDPSGKVVVDVTTHSHGQGHETTIAQIVASRLEVPLEDVRVMFGDTARTPYGMGTFGSRSIVMAGGAAASAANKVREKLERFAEHLLEIAADDLEVRGGVIGPKGDPALGIPIRDLARWAYHQPHKLPPGMEPSLEAVSTYDTERGTGTWANACHLAVVEVDEETGTFEIEKYVVVHDCGVLVNPTIVEGQIHGGVAHGIGGAKLEELVYDETGQLMTTTFVDYLLPTATDVPAIEVTHIETPSPFSATGSKGMGEGGAIAPGPALAAAVEDALEPIGDVVVNELPLTPERVLRFIDAARERPAACTGQQYETLATKEPGS